MKTLGSRDVLIHPEEFNDIELDSPALALFTDYKTHKPLEIEADTPAVQAQYLMRKAHVHLKLVVDNQQDLIGIISINELEDQNLLVLQNRGLDRKQILVSDLMVPREKINSLDFKQLSNCSVADLIATLQLNRAQHCVIVDQDTHHIRGVVSVADIARRLHIAIKVESPVKSFADIFITVNS